MPNNQIMRGLADITPNEFMKEQFEKSIEKAGRIGLHLVHIFYPDTISKEPCCQKAYFETYADAESYAYQYEVDHEHVDNPELGTYLIYINCEFFGSRLKGNYAKGFMGVVPEIEGGNKDE